MFTMTGDFPDGPVVKNLPSNAGHVSSFPGWGTTIPHATGQLSPSATSREPAHCSKDQCSKKNKQSECLKSSPYNLLSLHTLPVGSLRSPYWVVRPWLQ